MSNKMIGKTVSRVWSKKQFQQMRKDLKSQGLDVKKTSDGNGYELQIAEQLVLKVMNGRNGYFCSYVEDLFE